MYKFELSLKAQMEMFEAWAWYEEEREGLGAKFEADFFNKIQNVQKYPEHYPEKNKLGSVLTREALLDAFPFIIVYKIIEREKLIFVISVFHTSRHPKRKLK